MIARLLTFKPLVHDQRATALTLLALSMTALTGAAAIAVDVGSVQLAKRRLQGIADAGALAAASGNIAQDATIGARDMLARSGAGDVRIARLEPGRYDPTLTPDIRFQPGADDPDALRLSLEQDVPLYFGRILTGQATTRISARATAARIDLAAFSIGSTLAQLSGGLPNALLSGLAGTELNLTVMDTQALAALDIDLLGMSRALSVRLGAPGMSATTLFGQTIEVRTIVHAIADAASSSTAASLLHGIADRLDGRTIRLEDLIDLGSTGDAALSGAGAPIEVDALSLVRAVLDLSGNGNVVLDLAGTVPGLTSARLTILTDKSRTSSPWMTITNRHDVVIRTARTRLLLEAGLASNLSGIATLRVPIFIELAEAEARLADIRCAGSPATDGVTLAVTPAIGTIAITDIGTTAMAQFDTPPTYGAATLAQVLGTKITANARLTLGGAQSQSVHFTPSDIAASTTKTAWTQDAVQGLATSLLSRAQINVSVLGINLPLSPLVNAVGQILSLAAPGIDTLLNNVTGLLGLHLGGADVRVEKMRCGQPVLVA